MSFTLYGLSPFYETDVIAASANLLATIGF